MKRFKMTRRDFLKTSSFISGSAAGASLFVGDNPELEAATAHAAEGKRTTALAQCPYCGVGC
ncbi:MAG: twin-arginine translocation signal domain-containing protein, partial [Gammaproteobacteria bacterium]|nr:twin-arginine translocation signal domain-containing protein [Gammaproteobacteria bacterium]